MGVVNLYQIFDTKQMEIIADGITASEAVTLLDINNVHQVTNAAAVGIRIKRRYRVEAIDRVISPQSPLWVEWDLVRKMILRC